jgi:hypothetical protein
MAFAAEQVLDLKPKSCNGAKLSSGAYSPETVAFPLCTPDKYVHSTARFVFAHILWKRMCASRLVLG